MLYNLVKNPARLAGSSQAPFHQVHVPQARLMLRIPALDYRMFSQTDFGSRSLHLEKVNRYNGQDLRMSLSRIATRI